MDLRNLVVGEIIESVQDSLQVSQQRRNPPSEQTRQYSMLPRFCSSGSLIGMPFSSQWGHIQSPKSRLKYVLRAACLSRYVRKRLLKGS